MIGGIAIAPAFGKDKDKNKRGGYHEQGRYEHSQREYQSSHRYNYYYYPAPVYAPPVVVYVPVPYQSPGIELVFPIIIR
jgi:hypothetical protein